MKRIRDKNDSAFVSIKGIPVNGILYKRKPSLQTLEYLIREKASENLTKALFPEEYKAKIQEKLATMNEMDRSIQEKMDSNFFNDFSRSMCSSLADVLVEILVDYFVVISKQFLTQILAKFIWGNPIFANPSKEFDDEVFFRTISKFKRNTKRKAVLDIIYGQFPHAKEVKTNYWPSTSRVIAELSMTMMMLGHKDQASALLEAEEIHFSNLTYTRLDKYRSL